MNVRTPFGLFTAEGVRLISFGAAVSYADGNIYAKP